MSQHRSITQRLKKTNKPEVKLEIITEWAESWRKDQLQLIYRLNQAIVDKNYEEQRVLIAQLEAVTQKRFAGFDGIISDLTDLFSA